MEQKEEGEIKKGKNNAKAEKRTNNRQFKRHSSDIFRSSLLRFKGRNLAKTSDIQFCPKGTYTIHHNPLRVKGKEMKTKGTQKQEGTGNVVINSTEN